MNTASRLHDVAWCTRRLRVPTSCAHNPMVAPEFLQAARTPARPLVLIIDEEESARDLYGHWFFAHGFEVMCAVGIRGLSFALRWERPQLIVTELRARDLTLHQLIARLRCDETSRCIPVIVVTTSCDPCALNAAKEAGATVVLPKLADFEGLQSWVTALCR